MSTDGEEVKVLYDYTYSDEQGDIQIHKGDVYHLIEKTNNEWWQVCHREQFQADEKEEMETFFVPAQYVCLLKKDGDGEVNQAIASLDDVLVKEEEQTGSETAVEGSSVQNALGQAQIQGGLPVSTKPPAINGVEGNQDYVNLDTYRASANIAPLGEKSPAVAGDQDLYANLPFQLQQQKQLLEQQQQQQLQQQQQVQQQQQHHLPTPGPDMQLHSPRLEDGEFVRVLVPGLPWDVYEDKSRRKFFHNRDTGELTWKPPRKDKPVSPVNPGPVLAPSFQAPTVPSTIPTVSLVPAEGEEMEDYTKTEEEGDVFFVHNSSKERWQRLVDEVGRQYYHRIGSQDTQWDLPTTPRAKEGPDLSPRNGESGSEGAAACGSLMRRSKAKSMYGQIEQVSSGAEDKASKTLPPNFSPGSQLEKSPSLSSFNLNPPARSKTEDQLSGYLNKAKIAEMGKKKLKKSWAQTFVVLQASNLVFYKDHKAAAQKPGSPHGKPEGVISLQGAKVDFNPPKDITSKRNTIVLSVNSGSQFLLQSDDEKAIHQWLVRLKMAANDLAKESSSRDHDTGSLGRTGHQRSMSESGEGSLQKPNLLGIKARLLSLLVRRPTQEELVKQGIFKDMTFGSHLQALCDRDKSTVPNFVLECITAVENRGLEHDGLYRISGNLSEIQKLRYVIDKDEHHNLAEEEWDVHVLTGALKLFFRELKEPLFPFKTQPKFIEAIKKETRKEKLKGMKEALASLPKCNYETMRVLLQHLKNVIQFSAENRMQTQNVAIVFGPTLMWMGEADFNNMAVFTIYQSKVLEFLLLEYDTLFR